MTSQEKDALSRDKIINDLDKNFFVVANAGSGKTTILVNRMVALVEKGVDVSKICAITFTKNAAAEFLDRFQETLRKRASLSLDYEPDSTRHGELGKVTVETRERCQKALERINLCFLGTMDSFFNNIVSEFPIDANIPSSSKVIDNEEMPKYYIAEYEKISGGENLELYRKFCDFSDLNSNPQEVFANSINSVFDASVLDLQRIAPTKCLDDLFIEFKNKYEKVIKDDVNAILSMSYSDVPVNTKGYNDKFKDGFRIFRSKAGAILKEWTKSNFIGKIKDLENILKERKEDGHPTGIRFTSQPNTNFIIFTQNKSGTFDYDGKNNGFINLVDEVDEIKYTYSLDFLYSAKEYISDNLREKGKLSFRDYLLIFRNLLEKDIKDAKRDENGKYRMNIIDHIRERYSYFLIDESQDTSPFQTDIFLYLANDGSTNNPKECKPANGTLFILGDPKQSIYRFRAADVNSYKNTEKRFETDFNNNSEVLLLSRNFRSTELLINYFNDTFNGKLEDYELIPDISIVNGGTSGLFTFNGDYINIIKTMVGNDKYKISVKDKKEPIAPRYKDFMIITKNTDGVVEAISNLKKVNIPTYVEGKIDVSNSDAVESIYAVYKYIGSSNIKTSGALYNLLASPLFKMNVEKIIGKDINTIPNNIKSDIAKIDELKSEKDPIILYEKILDEIKLFNKIDYSNMDYAYYILEKLKEAYSNSLITNISDAIDFIERYISTKIERIMSVNYKPDAVHVANLHKVKGLEAPIVIICKAGIDNSRKNKISCRLEYDTNKSYIFKLDKKENFTYGIVTNKFDNKVEDEYLEATSEDKRLRYVAVTRARSYLFIEDEGKGFWGNLVSTIVPNTNNLYFTPFDDKEDGIDNGTAVVDNICKDISVNFDNNDSYSIQSPSKLELERVNNIYSSEAQLIEKDYDVRLKGTIIHRLMEMLVSSKCKLKKDELVNSIVTEYGIDKLNNKDIYINMLSGVYDTMNSGGYSQENGKPSDLLSVLENAECHCEVPFSYVDGTKVWYGNIDLLYIKDNKYYILDYKTNLDGTDLEKEYKNQLDAYKKALKEINKIDAESYIYHIKIE